MNPLHPKHIELFTECQKYRNEYVVLNEWVVHSDINYLKKILSSNKPIKLIIEATDAVHPCHEFCLPSMQLIRDYFVANPTSKLIYYSVNYYPEFENIPNILYRYFPEYHAYYYPIYSNILVDDSVLTKKFLCLNKRVDVTRLILYKKFYTDNLIEQSFFSFLGEDHLNGNLESINAVNQAEEIFNNLLKLYPEFTRLITPTDPFVKINSDTDIDQYINYCAQNIIDPSWKLDHTFYQQSFCSVISETSMLSMTPNFSEKTFRAIANGHPFIILGGQGSLEFLKNLGFDTFDDIFDNSYDGIADNYQRMIAVFKTIDKINSMDVDQLTQLKTNLLPRRLQNIQVYQDLYQRMLDKSTSLTLELKQFINTK